MSKLDGIRLNKFLSEIGYCSRREGDTLIDQERVTVNNQVAKQGQRVSFQDTIAVDGETVSKPAKDFVYLAFNKPKGIVCTTDTKAEKDNIIDFINYHKRIFPIGRLDKLSEGLIFLTSDGDIVNEVLRSNNKNEKEYLVTVDKDITSDFIKEMRSGVPILGTKTKKCEVIKVNKNTFTIILTQGLNRQIRRMCEYLGYRVTRLIRTRIMNIELDIPIGAIRELTKEEVKDLKSSASASTSAKATGDTHKVPAKKKEGSKSSKKPIVSSKARVGKTSVTNKKKKKPRHANQVTTKRKRNNTGRRR